MGDTQRGFVASLNDAVEVYFADATIAAAFVTASARQGTSKISRAYSGFAMTSRQNG